MLVSDHSVKVFHGSSLILENSHGFLPALCTRNRNLEGPDAASQKAQACVCVLLGICLLHC